MTSSSSLVGDWLRAMTASRSDFSALLADAESDDARGFEHTIREICQQPPTWAETASHLTALGAPLRESFYSCERIVLTGSGSSQYAGECVAPDLQRDLQLPVVVCSGGEILMSSCASASGEATLVVSLARSGDSPESAAVVDSLLATEPHTCHLIITCNPAGRLARSFADNPRVRVVSLGDRVNDRSLVMTGSFTNLALSAGFLGWIDKGSEFLSRTSLLCDAGQRLLMEWPDRLAAFVSGDIQRIVFLGHGCRFGAAREAALKMLEMTAGKVVTMAETYLGLRHGPMSFIDDKTLLVCFLSSDPLTRCYEKDLILELDAKKLGARKLIAGVENPGAGLCKGDDLAIAYETGRGMDDAGLALLDVMIAQILGFHRCRQQGLRPDSPSEDGVISRVVGEFQIHSPAEVAK